jgi:hypothetical protein
MGLSITSLLLPAALTFGAPGDLTGGAYERGLFCDSIDLVERVVGIADRGGDPQQAVRDINNRLDRRACLYTTHREVFVQLVGFERNIAANHTTYGIFRVRVSALGHQPSEIGDLVVKFPQPLMMYTLRNSPTDNSASR